MSLTDCATCGHKFTEINADYCYADRFMEVNHGGGQCRACYIKNGHPECINNHLNYSMSKFCHECGVSMKKDRSLN